MAIYQDTLVAGNRVLYISGQTPNTGEEVSEDIYTQMDVVLGKIVELLQINNLKINSIVKMNIYLTDRKYLLAMREKISEVFGEHKPTCSLIIVAGLVNENFKVEIDAIASI